jgi:transcriptional regulator with XRE-family HTH domain
VKNNVAEKIRLERLRLNLSQQNMADELGITAAAYSNLERGVSDISITRLFQVARILNQTPQWFIEEMTSSKDLFKADIQELNVQHDLLILQKEVSFLKQQIQVIQSELTKNK